MKLVLAALLFVTVPVNAQTLMPDKMCSSGFDEPAYLLIVEHGYELHIGSKIEILEGAGSLGTGLNGELVQGESQHDLEAIHYSEINMDTNTSPEDIRPISIFRDRVFWPCKVN